MQLLGDLQPLVCIDGTLMSRDDAQRLITEAEARQTAEELLRHLNIANVTIIGFSDGGIAAYRIAAAGKVAVNKLVTIGSR